MLHVAICQISFRFSLDLLVNNFYANTGIWLYNYKYSVFIKVVYFPHITLFQKFTRHHFWFLVFINGVTVKAIEIEILNYSFYHVPLPVNVNSYDWLNK